MAEQNNKYHLYISMFLLLVAGFMQPMAHAQNNPFKINDSIYVHYQNAVSLRQSPLILPATDSLYAEAVRLGDKKAQCIVYTLPIKYYFSTSNLEKLAEAAEKLKTISRANGYLQYYYYGWNQYIILLQNKGLQAEAMHECEKMKEEATKDNHPYGIFSCLRNMGHIQTTRGNPSLAHQYYRKALQYQLEHLPDQDPAQQYAVLSEYHRSKTERFDSAIYYCDQGIQTARTAYTLAVCKLEKAICLYSEDSIRQFIQYYPEVMQTAREARIASNNLNLVLVQIRKSITDGNQEEAHRYARMLTHPSDIYRQHAIIFQAFGDYKSAYQYMRQYYRMSDSIRNQLQNNEIAYYNAQFGNERLRHENARLDLQNADLQLKQMRQQLELDRQEAENKQLILEKQELELEQLRTQHNLQQQLSERQTAELERQQLVQQQQQEQSRYQFLIGAIIIISLLGFIAFLCFYLYRRRMNMHSLEKKNAELTDAKERALSASRMKDLFIQNMSHEIRTPLNSIVGFSQLLATPDMELSPEEQQEYSRLITCNSELLSTLVNDILGVAELESGNVSIHMDRVRCNELCRNALVTVSHRKPAGVELTFTSEADDGYTLHTDGKRVSQVLINFLTNAEKHTVKGTIGLHVSLSERPGSITFSVSDTGCGIPPEEAEHIFERFRKLDDFQQGSGLGLSICRLIAKQMQGSVELDTGYTGGARFLFVLPLPSGMPQ